MHSTELLERGREILDPALLPHGFRFESGAADVGSGGPFARGAYVRDHHRLDFSVRWALGEVTYRVGDTLIAHEDLMRVIAGPGKSKYPGFSEDPLDGFRHLSDDLEHHGKVSYGPWTRISTRSRNAQPARGRDRGSGGSPTWKLANNGLKLPIELWTAAPAAPHYWLRSQLNPGRKPEAPSHVRGRPVISREQARVLAEQFLLRVRAMGRVG